MADKNKKKNDEPGFMDFVANKASAMAEKGYFGTRRQMVERAKKNRRKNK